MEDNKQITEADKKASAEKIEEVIRAINDACKVIGENDIVQNVIVIGYVNTGVDQGFVSTQKGLNSLESTTTFLLDYASKNISNTVREKMKEQAEELKKEIEKEENKDETNRDE